MGYGMQNRTKKYQCSSKKAASCVFSRMMILFFIVALIVFPLILIRSAVSDTPMFIPSTPSGTTYGYVGIDYEYTIVTMNPDSYWLIDWGDGSNTSWLQLEENYTSIVQKHRWNTPGFYQLHVKFKSETVPYGSWSDAMIIEITTFSSGDFPNKPILRTGKLQGVSGYEYTYSAYTTDPHESQVRYRFDYNNEIISEWTPFVPSGSVSYLPFIWEKPGEYSIRVQACNEYGLESLWSDSVHISMKNASEDDGSSVDLLVFNGNSYHILFSSNTTGTFYNSSAGISNDVKCQGEGIFLIDDDSDGRWEYIYAPSMGEIQPYEEKVPSMGDFLSSIPLLLIIIIISIIVIVVGVILILIRTGYIYLYEEEVAVEK
jgi:hypothetical protein